MKSPRWRDPPDKGIESLLRGRRGIWWVCQPSKQPLDASSEDNRANVNFFYTHQRVSSAFNCRVRSVAIKLIFFVFCFNGWCLFFNERPCGVRGPGFTVNLLRDLTWSENSLRSMVNSKKATKKEDEEGTKKTNKKQPLSTDENFMWCNAKRQTGNTCLAARPQVTPCVFFLAPVWRCVCNTVVYWFFARKPSWSDGRVCAKTNRCRSQILLLHFNLTLKL